MKGRNDRVIYGRNDESTAVSAGVSRLRFRIEPSRY